MPSNYCKDVTVVGENDLGHDWQVQLAPSLKSKKWHMLSALIFLSRSSL